MEKGGAEHGEEDGERHRAGLIQNTSDVAPPGVEGNAQKKRAPAMGRPPGLS